VKPAHAIPLALLAGILVRGPFWIEALKTPVDGDTAIVGLMARHLGEGATLWGQPYGSPLDAWVAAPFVAVFGPRVEALRLPVFLLSLALIPLAYALGRSVDSRAGLPAALLLACPPPYLLLLSAMPPPLYATTLVLCGVILVLAIRLGAWLALAEGGAPPPPGAGKVVAGLAAWGALAGLALWTHLMSASVVVAALAWLAWRAWPRPGRVAIALLPLLLVSAPYWTSALHDRQATRVVSLQDRRETFASHFLEVLLRLHEPVGGLLGTHVPVVADDAEHVVGPPMAAAVILVALETLLLVIATSYARKHPAALLLLAAAGLALAAFPFPLRSAPHNIRFLTPMALPALVLLVAPVATRPRRAAVVVLALACVHLLGGSRLLAEWRRLDRADAPFLLPDLRPVRHALSERGIRRAYASYGPAYRLTWESGEELVVSQPWNERFRHHPLPYLDEVRFAKNVAWVLTPRIPTDLPTPVGLEEGLRSIGGTWRRTDIGAASLFHDFTPPFSPTVSGWPGAGAVGDLDLGTVVRPDPSAPTTFVLPEPRRLDAITLVSGAGEPRLLRSMDIEVSADGMRFEPVAGRRRREERLDLRWVNGHPQYVIDHDLLAVALGGRLVKEVKVSPVASADDWVLAEVLLHGAEEPAERRRWDEWLDPGLDWRARREALAGRPLPDREDWFYRSLLVGRREGGSP
jgi:hypothetical protein